MPLLPERNLLPQHDFDRTRTEGRMSLRGTSSRSALKNLLAPTIPELDTAQIRVLIESALAYAGGTHTADDVLAAIRSGDAQLWSGPHSCVVTEIDRQPRESILHFFLAAGLASELKAMEPGIVAWGAERGCTRARMVGRKGWERSFLTSVGWKKSDLIMLEREIPNGCQLQ